MATAPSVDAYIAAQPEAARAVLDEVRTIIRKALPDAGEIISYGIPAYRQDGQTVVFFAGWKRHYSLYPVREDVRAALGDAVAGYTISKGTIRFPLDEPVPAALIGRIVGLLAAEAAARAGAKAAAKAKPAAAKRKRAG